MGSRRDAILLVVLLGAILALSVIVGSRSGDSPLDPRASTFLSGPYGTRALHDVLKELKLPVERRLQPYADAKDSLAGPLVLLAPSDGPSPVELGRLAEWVRGGGTLLYAAGRGDPTLDTLELKVRSLADDTTEFGEYRFGGLPAGALPSPRTRGVLRMEGFRRTFDPRSPALRRPGVVVLAQVQNRPAVVDFPLGLGRVVAFSDAAPLANVRLRRGGTATLFARVAADAAKGRTLWFDEYHHGYKGGGSVVAGTVRFLTRRPAGRLALQLLAVGAGFLLLFGRRLGAPLPPPPARRRSPLEHVEALAGAYRQAGARRTARHLLLAGLARRLGRRPARPGAAEAEMLDRLSANPSAGGAARAIQTEWSRGERADLVALSRDVDRYLEEVRRP